MQSIPTDYGVVVITQTCDALKSEFLQVCRVERDLPKEQADLAAKGRITRYVPLPGYDADAFADLATVATVSREHLAGKLAVCGASRADDRRRLRLGIGRRFSRVALPDAVTRWLDPLRETATKQAGHSKRKMSWSFDRIRQIRIASSSGWSGPTYSLEVVFVLHDGVLPQFADDDMPDRPDSIESWLGGKTPADIETRLRQVCDSEGYPRPDELRASKVERYYLWAGLAEALVDLCRRRGNENTSVFEAEGRIVSPDEFTLRDVWASEELDLEHLSFE
ncbi:MAG: hypothetical protein FWD29_02950 [Micrococcales bacterium]|nr:hypothetical protein [Micrococcales bacterium]